ncbi:uncharacterized protein LOC130815588 [Amaranthus tricolor]|uniref:uncharacterized protein LOC130815588 n=1 Tax=Amaranthus tricolor TaxID=29722 RepID=UPI002584A48C|nr:uncharacterized protein LOC130815588 [Amaranthus tricolor]
MGATMAILIILAIVMCLVFVLLAELYCSILLRRRKLNDKNPDQSMVANPRNPQQPQNQNQLIPSPLSSFYAQGVLDAPRNFLFPKLPINTEIDERPKHGKLHQFLRVQSPQLLGLASSSLSSSTLQMQQPNSKPEINIEVEFEGKNLMYISNPIYDNEVSGVGATPFETSDSLPPSQLDRNEEKKENEKEMKWSPCSLPLSPMKEVPAKADESVCLRDAGCLGSSCSESNTRIAQFSSSASPHTSPSW